MKMFRLAAVVLIAAACNKTGGSGAGATLATAEDTANYLIGQQVGGGLKQDLGRQKVPVRATALASGLEAALAGNTTRISMEQAQAFMAGYQQKLMASHQVEADSLTTAEQKFFEGNAKQPGIKATETGIQYKVLREGKGGHPKATSNVTVHYRGTLLDGKGFDSTYGGPPATLALSQVIPGWREGMALMAPGSKYRFWIPSRLAYGPPGRDAIPPYATLIFDIELVSFR